MQRADLHTHTTFSDGTLTPAEVVAHARELGLAAVGITDHDAIDGVAEALEAGERLGVTVVPGVEVNTDVPGSEVHMLGYFIDIDSSTLREALKGLREGRLRRAEQIVTKLRGVGVPVELERVLAIADGVGAVGRPHIARAIVEAGFAADISDAFDRYLSPGRPAHVPRPRFTPEEAIVAIREGGGAPVLAHPASAGRDECLRDWMRLGLVGIEADHTSHRPDEVLHYYRIARELGLIATAGSDFHGSPGTGAPLGERTCGLEVIDRLREAAERIRAGLAAAP
ncbi:MAG TPA: PHP domain-containing protein [Armatimonadota bacterium]|jgi:predicted metal-dependent phosphoesterase TrpH|nr:PHP domain-containing protein [Armatimonadota bacterium]HOJ23558.1 PHP domain-containing protein [Armatimonadota bacterium]HOM81731.1 PHP domain-containing protein [Armatimonadota bacterium]HPO73173.1 PHP domain-containing protein [Armatimonadota bacterium]